MATVGLATWSDNFFWNFLGSPLKVLNDRDSWGKFSLWLILSCSPIKKLPSLLFKIIQFKFWDLLLVRQKQANNIFFFFSAYVLQYYHQVKPRFISWLGKQFDFFQFLLKTSAVTFLGFVTAGRPNSIYFCIADISAEDLAHDCICFPSHGMLMFKWFLSGCQVPGECGGCRCEMYSLWNG